MTITIRGQILAALRNNPGLNSARIASMIGMTTKKISGTVRLATKGNLTIMMFRKEADQ